MATLRVILNDQLNETISSLQNCNKTEDIIFMAETLEEFTYVKHHKKKLVFLISSMRHFRHQLENKMYNVVYVKISDKNNSGSISHEVKRILQQVSRIKKIVVTHPGEYRILKYIKQWEKNYRLPVIITPDDRFIASQNDFQTWVAGRKQLRMEYFYRAMRKKHTVLIDKNKNPIGGKWNYDAYNRKSLKSAVDNIPVPYQNKPDSTTKDAIKDVKQYFSNHFGDINPFFLAVTRDQALAALDRFIEQRLKYFGDYQDAMIQGQPWMYHSHLSVYLNCGLLLPAECVLAAENAYYNNQVPLNSAEGFIRQIIGWREYIRGIYWLRMPDYYEQNFFSAFRNLPSFYWTAKTKMNCLRHCILETKKNAYAHHIQRLMILGNFVLITGVNPKQVNEWFLTVYSDAYEWVELPNVNGMILFADGGFLASKPYASGGHYIKKMSNYCSDCAYQVSKKTGKDACPFNYLYWNFLSTNRDKLENNPRMNMVYRIYDNMSKSKKIAIENDSKAFFTDN